MVWMRTEVTNLDQPAILVTSATMCNPDPIRNDKTKFKKKSSLLYSLTKMELSNLQGKFSEYGKRHFCQRYAPLTPR